MPTIFDTPAGGPGGRDGGSRLQAWVDSTVGSTIAEKYEIIRCLGTGGMGGVFLARHRLLAGAHFALKLIIPRPQCGPPDEQEKRFMREARTAMKFVHPRAAQVRDFGFDRGRGVMYMAMDYLEGRRLDLVLGDAVARNRDGETVLSKARALRITRLILDVLRSAHAADVIHRDLKPGNVFLVSSGNVEDVRILDFGCAKVVGAAGRGGQLGAAGTPARRAGLVTDRITGPGIVMGTVQYMAPEQARGEKLDRRADLYSVGVMLYEMLTGTIPHEAKKHSLLILARALNPPIPLEKARPDIRFPAVVRAMVSRALMIRRDDRFADADEFAGMVEDALYGRSPPAGRPRLDGAPGAETGSGPRTPTTVALPRGGAPTARRPGRLLGATGRLAAAVAVGAALACLGWSAWTRVGYSRLIARGEAALAKGDFARALESFDGARELRPAEPLARELTSRALAEIEARRAAEEGRRGNIEGLRVHTARAEELGADGVLLRKMKELVAAGTSLAEAERLAEAGRLSGAKALLDAVPGDLPEPWATRAAAGRSAVDAELGAAGRLLEDALRDAGSGDGPALEAAATGLADFLERYPRHPRRPEAILARARVAGRIRAAARAEEAARVEATARLWRTGLVVESSPPGLDCLVDGRSVGRTPAVLLGNTDPGPHAVTLVDGEGFASRHRATVELGEVARCRMDHAGAVAEERASYLAAVGGAGDAPEDIADACRAYLDRFPEGAKRDVVEEALRRAEAELPR